MQIKLEHNNNNQQNNNKPQLDKQYLKAQNISKCNKFINNKMKVIKWVKTKWIVIHKVKICNDQDF